jgi:hypothetical protein
MYKNIMFSHSRLCVFILIMIIKAIYFPHLEFTTYIKKYYWLITLFNH